VSNLSLPSSVELISVHIPKTAGSTFGGGILPYIYGEENILYDYDGLSVETLIKQGKLTNKIKAIHGHFPAVKYKYLFDKVKLVVWLRNPILMLISWYYFWNYKRDVFYDKSHKYVVENSISFRDYIEMEYKENNIKAYFLEGLELKNFNFVGLQEFFSEDLLELTNLLGWRMVDIPIYNINKYPDYQKQVIKTLGDISISKRILDIKKDDMDMYKLALKMRYERQGLSNHLQMYEQILKNSRAILEGYQVRNL
jgi:hypothetical protein